MLALVFLLALSASASAELRITRSLNPDWKFLKSNPPGAEKTDFDDSQWSTVSVPHTYNDTDTFDEMAPDGHRGEMNQWGGITWYRKHFEVPADWKGRTLVIEFEAVRQVAEVYLNGKLIGKSSSGFVPFGFDITKHVKFGQPNVLAVKCDNSFATDATEGVPITEPNVGAAKLPWNNPHWHPAHGGIYRNVWLYALHPVHITLPLYSDLGTTGVYAYATNVTESSADIGIEAQVHNLTGAPVAFTLLVEILDRTGQVVFDKEVSAKFSSAGGTPGVKGKLENPQRWEPMHPYLYSVRVTLSMNGQPVDQTSVPLGIRSAEWSTKTGLRFNGRPLKLRGWGQKSTDEWAGLGAAMPDWMHYFTVNMMREAGGNFIRWGHTAGGPAEIAAGDLYGQVTLQPGVDGEKDIADPGQWAIRAAAFRDTIIYFRNNPSVLIWEGGNQSTTREHAAELRGYMDAFDPHGGRVYAHRRANDVVGEFMQVTIGTEGGHEQPQLPVVEGEYNREEAPRRAWDRQTPGYENYHAKGAYDLTAEEFAINQVAHWWRKIGSMPDHCGGANWIFSDSTSGGRVTTEVTRTSGEVDAVRLPKEAYHACAAMFRNEPTATIIGHWNYPAGTVKPVYVVSNQQKVELFVNGQSLGFGAPSDRYLYTFSDVRWAAGEVRAVAYDKDGKPAAEQSKRTSGPAVGLRLTPITGPDGWRADGADIALVDVEAIDAQGNRCPTFEKRVNFKMEGPAVWRGGYNSGLPKSTNNDFLNLEAGINRVALRSTLTPGAVTLQAVVEGLPPASLTLESTAIARADGMTTVTPAIPPPPALKTPSPDRLVTEGAAQSGPRTSGVVVKSFNYSGPTMGASVALDARKGKPSYSDGDMVFSAVPETWERAEYLRLPNADKGYSALDLISLTVRKTGVVAVAYDDRLKPPAWLTGAFTDSGQDLQVGVATFSIYQRNVAANETLTLGGNAETPQPDSAMYIVLVK